MRGVLGLLAGIVAGLASMMLAGFVGGLLYPVETVAGGDVVAGLRAAPIGAQAAVLVSWFAGAFGGAAAAKAVSGASWPGWTIAGLLALVLAFIFLLPLPVWLQALAPVAPLLGGLLADLLIGGRTPDAPPASDAD